jgi:hypothetical protein
MDYTYKDLKGMTVAQLREIAAEIEHEAVKGYTQLNKEHLIDALCEALGIEKHVHHEVKGLNKGQIKSQIRKLKKERDKALEAHDHAKLKEVRKEIKHLKKKLRKAMV